MPNGPIQDKEPDPQFDEKLQVLCQRVISSHCLN
jgi:hypothetical protein